MAQGAGRGRRDNSRNAAQRSAAPHTAQRTEHGAVARVLSLKTGERPPHAPARIASKTSRVWKQIASSVARATCARVVKP